MIPIGHQIYCTTLLNGPHLTIMLIRNISLLPINPLSGSIHKNVGFELEVILTISDKYVGMYVLFNTIQYTCIVISRNIKINWCIIYTSRIWLYINTTQHFMYCDFLLSCLVVVKAVLLYIKWCNKLILVRYLC